jgi:hypothetical protein
LSLLGLNGGGGGAKGRGKQGKGKGWSQKKTMKMLMMMILTTRITEIFFQRTICIMIHSFIPIRKCINISQRDKL